MTPASSGNIPPPYALAIVLCETIWHDPETGKRFILGCLSDIRVRSFPEIRPTLGVHLAITNGHGKVPLRVQLVDADDEREPIWTYQGEIEFNDPRSIAELDFMIEGATFPEAGEYQVQVFACDEFIGERRLSVVEFSED